MSSRGIVATHIRVHREINGSPGERFAACPRKRPLFCRSIATGSKKGTTQKVAFGQDDLHTGHAARPVQEGVEGHRTSTLTLRKQRRRCRAFYHSDICCYRSGATAVEANLRYLSFRRPALWDLVLLPSFLLCLGPSVQV